MCTLNLRDFLRWGPTEKNDGVFVSDWFRWGGQVNCQHLTPTQHACSLRHLLHLSNVGLNCQLSGGYPATEPLGCYLRLDLDFCSSPSHHSLFSKYLENLISLQSSGHSHFSVLHRSSQYFCSFFFLNLNWCVTILKSNKYI